MRNNNNDSTKKNYETMSIKDLRSLLTLRGYDCSQCLEKSELVATAKRMDATDYDEEARKLFRELNLSPTAAASYSNLNAIWSHPDGRASVYVGNARAACELRTLRERHIAAIVNCQDEFSNNSFEDLSDMHYHRFAVSRLAVSHHSASPFQHGFQQAFAFIQRHLEEGNSVLIHCLAGAHRAGTVGTAWLMYKTEKSVDEALKLAKACRPIISPFGTLLELLHCLQIELESQLNTDESN